MINSLTVRTFSFLSILSYWSGQLNASNNAQEIEEVRPFKAAHSSSNPTNQIPKKLPYIQDGSTNILHMEKEQETLKKKQRSRRKKKVFKELTSAHAFSPNVEAFSMNPSKKNAEPLHSLKEEGSTEKEDAEEQTIATSISRLALTTSNTKKKSLKKIKQIPDQRDEIVQEPILTLSPSTRLINLSKRSIACSIEQIEAFIKIILEEKRDTPLAVRVPLVKEEISQFHEHFTEMIQKYPFPLNWGITNKGPIKHDTPQQGWTLEVSICSLEKKRELVEKEYVYKIDQQLNKDLDWPIIYDVAMRSGFNLEDFKYNNSVKIRVLEIQSVEEQDYLKEIRQFFKTRLNKDSNPFHIVVPKTHPSSPLKPGILLNSLYTEGGKQGIFISDRGIVCDNQSNSLYICINNDQRNILDLHGKTLKEGGFEGRNLKQAREESLKFIMNAYENFQEEVMVLTGRGNHVNANGKKGILFEAFEKQWVKEPELKPIIKTYIPLSGNGGYKIIFRKPEQFNISAVNSEEAIILIKQQIAHMHNNQRQRLWIKISPTVKSFYNHEFNFLSSIANYLSLYELELFKNVSPISFDTEPGQLKIILNKVHPRYPHSICWGDSFGNPLTSGNIGIY